MTSKEELAAIRIGDPDILAPTTSGYSWIETEPLFVQKLSTEGQVLVYDESLTASAIIDTDDDTGLITVNGLIINWHRSIHRLIRIHQNALFGKPQFDNPLLAPGQTEDNVVNMLTCGHEVDTEREMPHGKRFMCPVHSWQTVLAHRQGTSIERH